METINTRKKSRKRRNRKSLDRCWGFKIGGLKYGWFRTCGRKGSEVVIMTKYDSSKPVLRERYKAGRIVSITFFYENLPEDKNNT